MRLGKRFERYYNWLQGCSMRADCVSSAKPKESQRRIGWEELSVAWFLWLTAAVVSAKLAGRSVSREYGYTHLYQKA